eukprot:TRINITY_DN6536_c0_g1_i4.p5 TRINITY_DN6536_c0_g1~~TRINITY_DN6536_c0_g1_i4.p5  ORF type:complete len:101 (-),score=0.04 TRINITY_DN6536_c0_g1_i4:163-465(-)
MVVISDIAIGFNRVYFTPCLLCSIMDVPAVECQYWKVMFCRKFGIVVICINAPIEKFFFEQIFQSKGEYSFNKFVFKVRLHYQLSIVYFYLQQLLLRLIL